MREGGGGRGEGGRGKQGRKEAKAEGDEERGGG